MKSSFGRRIGHLQSDAKQFIAQKSIGSERVESIEIADRSIRGSNDIAYELVAAAKDFERNSDCPTMAFGVCFTIEVPSQ